MTPAQDRLKDQLCAALAGILRRKKVHIPEAGLPVWESFLTLTQTRRHHANGPEPISLLEIEAYNRMFGPISRQHVEMLLAMDLVWLEWAVKPSGKSAKKKEPVIPLTAEMFDFAFGR
ncbi:hypothetical protein EOW65_17760 [Sinirhodobacter ferrireducens]|uniref:Uncharacterized protein n=1 Tax=Paenirhodobacter ferrireducens TaxID=1215032 RepID=A0A443L7J2_9RHOB|nr:hypothetical protein [Sinirhodobacter ferrireducens]RWR44991.1 hypothetical protein EOW65_17760 [Sinirhodobacter ferrireducens]